MERFDLFRDLNERTDGAVYIGVVGPVRTGKSTFIKRFMELLVLPFMEDSAVRQRLVDQLPQSGTGRTIMTTEPKFVPEEAAVLVMPEGISVSVRLVDCVGYAVPGALGYTENDTVRLVNTPWDQEAIPFEEAAEIGTRKVIEDHSTIGLVIVTDGSISDIPREDYLEAEAKVISELKELGKPFLVLLNSAHPYEPDTLLRRSELEEQHQVPVIAVNAMEMESEDIFMILQELLYEFPVTDLQIRIPAWVDELPYRFWLREEFAALVAEARERIRKLRDLTVYAGNGEALAHVQRMQIAEMNLGSGEAVLEMETADELFIQVLSEVTGIDMSRKESMMFHVQQMNAAKKEYDKYADAIAQTAAEGYGIVSPQLSEMMLEEPEIIRQGGRFGVRLKASAPAYHIIQVKVKSEVTPIVGTEKQSEELVRYLSDEFEADPKKLWSSNLFGKSLHELVSEGINNKLEHLPQDAREKMRLTLEKIVNEGNGGLIAILL